MKTKLVAIGDGIGVTVARQLLDLLRMEVGTEVQLTTDGERLILETAAGRRSRVLEASRRAMAAHGETFRELAK